jgi:hypothetical protein
VRRRTRFRYGLRFIVREMLEPEFLRMLFWWAILALMVWGLGLWIGHRLEDAFGRRIASYASIAFTVVTVVWQWRRDDS